MGKFDEVLDSLLKPIEGKWFKGTVENHEFRFVWYYDEEWKVGQWRLEETDGHWTKEEPLDSNIWSLDVSFFSMYIDDAYKQLNN